MRLNKNSVLKLVYSWGNHHYGQEKEVQQVQKEGNESFVDISFLKRSRQNSSDQLWNPDTNDQYRYRGQDIKSKFYNQLPYLTDQIRQVDIHVASLLALGSDYAKLFLKLSVSHFAPLI